MIIGENVRLRAIEHEDIPHFVEWLNDPAVTRNLTLVNPISRVDEENWFANLKNSPIEEHPLGIEVKTENGWTLIGNCSFHKIDWLNRQSEVGIFIGEQSYWNRGFGRKAMQLLLRHGFNNLNLNRIWLQVYSTNPRAIRSYQACGFVEEGRLRQARFQEGQYIDVIVMSVLRSEWHEPQP